MENAILELLKKQIAAYPALQLKDCVKLLYQRILGSEHIAVSADKCFAMLSAEKKKIGTDATFPSYEEIGENSCRFHLLPLADDADTLRTLSKLFLKSMETLSENAAEKKIILEDSLSLLLDWIKEGALPFPYEEASQFLSRYRENGCPAIHHSNIYRDTYHPAYRLLRTDFAHYFSLFAQIDKLLSRKSHVVLAIDGKCGSGKSTLASILCEVYSLNLIHMDDFYLPTDLRTGERLATPGGNIHYERFSSQVLPSLKALHVRDSQNTYAPFTPVSYQIFDCHRMAYRDTCPTISDKPLTIVEGSYSLRPEFREAYDLKVFLDISAKRQKERLLARNGEEAYKNFESKWIPMENNYFGHYRIADCCDLVFTSE